MPIMVMTKWLLNIMTLHFSEKYLKYKYNDCEGDISWEQPLIATADNILWHVNLSLCYTKQLSKKNAVKMQVKILWQRQTKILQV